MASGPTLVPVAAVLLAATTSPCAGYYGPLTLDVTDSDLRSSMSSSAECSWTEKVGGSTSSISGDGCHTQGIALGAGIVATSCDDGSANRGALQIYESGDLQDYDLGGPLEPLVVTDPEWAGSWSHTAIGQGLYPESRSVNGMFPVVSSDSRSAAAVVTLVNKAGARICQFTHDDGNRYDRHLGAVALTEVDDIIWMTGCSWGCDYLSVYSLDPALPDCGPSLEVELHMAKTSGNPWEPTPWDPPRFDSGAGDRNWGGYNSVALFIGRFGVPYLVGGHDGWLDTWRIYDLGLPSMRLGKLAKKNWGNNPSDWGGRDLFYEGMTLSRVDETTVDVWAAPHDYGTDDCGPGRECTHAIYSCRKALR